MREPCTYIFKKRSAFAEGFLVAMLASLVVWGSISVFPNLLLLLLIGAIPSVLGHFQLYVYRITRQFNKYDHGKTITINADRNTLTLTTHDETLVIKKDDVEKVEIYDQNDLGRFGRFEYVVIYTAGKNILITKFTIPLLVYDKMLESFLSKKPRTHFKKRFNFIDESKFPGGETW